MGIIMRKGVPYGLPGDAEETPYDNRESGLDAKNVQEAIDKLKELIGSQGGTGSTVVGNGERGLSIYLLNAYMAGSAEWYNFTDFHLPYGYAPKVNDLVLYLDGNLAYIHEINMDNQIAMVAALHVSLAGIKGDKGEDGKDGTSVTVERYTESKVDGGYNTVVFSDGTALRIQNGSKGSKGDKGDDGKGVTHEFDGTILTFTTASGTDSIDLGNRTSESLELKDVATGDVYKLYIENGELKTSIGYEVVAYTEDCLIEISGIRYNSLGSAYVVPGSGIEITLTPSNYATYIESIYVEMGTGVDITDSVYTQTENGGKVIIPSVTDNVFVQAHGAKETRFIIGNLMNCGGWIEQEVENGDEWWMSVIPDAGYCDAFVSVSMGGVDITNTAWNGSEIYIEHVTANVSISGGANEEV